MKQRVALIALAAVAAIALLVWLLTAAQPPDGAAGGRPGRTPSDADAGAGTTHHPPFHRRRRHAPPRTALGAAARRGPRTHPGGPEELLAGPDNTARLASVVPYAAQLEAVFVDQNGNAFLDLTAPPEDLTGSSTEIILTYGIVNSVILNCPEISAVQVLFGGHEVPTLTGHLDLSKPLVLNRRFIAAS